MTTPGNEMVKVSFDAPAAVIRSLDVLGRARTLSRADILREAVREYLAAGTEPPVPPGAAGPLADPRVRGYLVAEAARREAEALALAAGSPPGAALIAAGRSPQDPAAAQAPSRPVRHDPTQEATAHDDH